MKILLSAFACRPDLGSEPGVGWGWVVALCERKYQVWVITQYRNKQYIEEYLSDNHFDNPPQFIYCKVPKILSWWRKDLRGIRTYYFLWQFFAYRMAMKIHETHFFDLVHHVTFVSVRQPSFMGNLGIPFIFGPVAGGENAPWRLRFHYGVRGFIIDAVRDLINLLVKLDPLMWLTFSQAQKIYVTSEQTKMLVPSRFHQKTKVQLAVGLDSNEINKSVKKTNQTGRRILYVGHFLYWKGMGLGIRAFAKLVKQVPGTRLTMVGKGPDEKRWRNLAEQLNIADKIDWIPWVNRKELAQIYQSHDVFLFPSLHDSGGMVVLEAMSYGLPVVCLDLGGPGVMVDDSCGIKIAAGDRTDKEVIEDLGAGLINLTGDSDLMQELGRGAVNTANRYIWQGKVDKLYVQLIRA